MHKIADRCSDQLPVLSHVGRGPKGDSAKVEIIESEDGAVRLKASTYDAAKRTWVQDSISKNIAAGKLEMEYVINEVDDPKTFNIVFKYTRIDHPDESWTKTSPSIPYTEF